MWKEWILPVLWAAIGSVGFGLIFGMRTRKLLYTFLGGGLTWLLYLLCMQYGMQEAIAYAVAAGVGTLYSEIMARVLLNPVTDFIIPVNIPLVPGGSLYYTFLGLMESDTAEFLSRGRYTLMAAGAMALGIFVATMLFKTVWEVTKRLRLK